MTCKRKQNNHLALLARCLYRLPPSTQQANMSRSIGATARGISAPKRHTLDERYEAHEKHASKHTFPRTRYQVSVMIERVAADGIVVTASRGPSPAHGRMGASHASAASN